MRVKIFPRPQSTMQSGGRLRGAWLLEPIAENPLRRDGVMGWRGGSSTSATQVRMTFDTMEEARSFARRSGYSFQLQQEQSAEQGDKEQGNEQHKKQKLDKTREKVLKNLEYKNYAHNFSSDRRRSWTH